MPFRYIYGNARIDADERVLAAASDAAERLLVRLRAVDLGELGISEYNRRYLTSKLNNPAASFQLYTYLLTLCIRDSDVAASRLTVVDYGGGSGVFSLLAREYGIGTVVYNDIYEVSCEDYAKLARAVGAEADHVVCGEMDALAHHVAAHRLTVDAVCSFDVIEHIYDMEGHIEAYSALPGQLRLVWGSGAIAANPVIRRSLVKKHHQFEHADRPRVYGHKERDSLRSYASLRRDIISAYDPGLDERTVNRLVSATRGLMKPDIERCVDDFRREGRIARAPDHATNTCDPLTGNWAERLMDLVWLSDLLATHGFETDVLPGYWGGASDALRRTVKSALNLLISNVAALRFRLAPYYVVIADRRRDAR